MGMSEMIRYFLTGNGNLLKSIFGIFMPHSESAEVRAQEENKSARQQFGQEFRNAPQGRWNLFIEGLNRLPRPALVLSILGVLVYTPVDPEHMVEVFTAWSLIPPGLWAIMCVIVAFYFGGRSQLKEHNFRAQFLEARENGKYELERIREIQEFRKKVPPEAPVPERTNRAIENYHKHPRG